MELLTLISLVALAMAILALQRTGWIYQSRRQMEDLSEKSNMRRKGPAK